MQTYRFTKEEVQAAGKRLLNKLPEDAPIGLVATAEYYINYSKSALAVDDIYYDDRNFVLDWYIASVASNMFRSGREID
jgi:hypothetical protein